MRDAKISTDRCTEDRLCRSFDGESSIWSATAVDNELRRAAVVSAISSIDCRCRTDRLPRCRSCNWMKRRRSQDFNSNSLVRRMLAATSSARLQKTWTVTLKQHRNYFKWIRCRLKKMTTDNCTYSHINKEFVNQCYAIFSLTTHLHNTYHIAIISMDVIHHYFKFEFWIKKFQLCDVIAWVFNCILFRTLTTDLIPSTCN